ncbi:hypothetical protein RP20_CCG008399 [Aedes albopictus]|nr:hypothetical protein RP20_CCG008399 [Aedes albopictus]
MPNDRVGEMTRRVRRGVHTARSSDLWTLPNRDERPTVRGTGFRADFSGVEEAVDYTCSYRAITGAFAADTVDTSHLADEQRTQQTWLLRVGTNA